MISPRYLLLFAFWLLWPAGWLQAQEPAKILTDTEDARIIGVTARENAVTNLLTEARQLKDAGDKLKAARTLNRAGRFQLRQSQFTEALATYQQALDLGEETTDYQNPIDSLNGLARAYTLLERCGDAQWMTGRALYRSEKQNYAEGKAEALMISADCESNNLHALESAQQSLEFWQSINHQLGIARAHMVVGEYQMVRNDLFASTKSFETSAALWRELNVPYQVAECLNNLGFIEYRKGAWQASLGFYIDAERLIDEAAEPYIMGQIKSGFAEAFVESGLAETGMDRYLEALEYFRLAKDVRAQVGMKWGIGKTHYINGNYPKAIEVLTAARPEAEAIPAAMITALCDDYLGRTYFELNDYPTALRYFEAAIDGFTRSGNPMELARTRAFIGHVYEQEGDLAKAKAYYEQALTAFQKSSDRLNEAATLSALGGLELKKGDVDAAEQHLLESLRLTDEMRRVSFSTDLTAAFSDRVSHRYEKYIDCLMRKYKSTGSRELVVRAFEASELGRARSLTELFHATRVNLFPGVDPQLADKEKKLRELIQINENSKVTLLAEKSYTRAELETLDQQHKQLKAEHDQLVQSNPVYAQVYRPTSWDLERIQQQVVADDQTALLEYSLGSEKSYAWVVTRSGIKSYELANETEIRRVAERVINLLQRPPLASTRSELPSALKDLAQVILAPVADELKAQQLIIVPDGVLNYIPFQVLPSPVTNEPLVAANVIVNAPSASILGEIQQEAAHRQPAPKLLAAFGDPVFAPNYVQRKDTNSSDLLAVARWRSALRDADLNRDAFDPSALLPLFHAKRELESLREVAGENAVVVSEYDATRDRFLSTDLGQYSVLHLVTHGLFNPERPENSGFVLSTVDRQDQQVNGFIGVKEIYELRAPVRLVVLSACQTALGKHVRGEGLLGLTRGFMGAGASSVVASLWNVDDGATAELMKHFYTNLLQEGMKPAEALREAQNVIRKRPEWSSPYYWAAFTLQGDYRHPFQPPTQPSRLALAAKLLIIITVMIVLASFLWWYRNRRSAKLTVS